MCVKTTKLFLIKAFIVTILTFLFGTSSLVINDLKADVLEGDYNIILITIDTLRSDHLSCYRIFNIIYSEHLEKAMFLY